MRIEADTMAEVQNDQEIHINGNSESVEATVAGDRKRPLTRTRSSTRLRKARLKAEGSDDLLLSGKINSEDEGDELNIMDENNLEEEHDSPVAAVNQELHGMEEADVPFTATNGLDNPLESNGEVPQTNSNDLPLQPNVATEENVTHENVEADQTEKISGLDSNTTVEAAPEKVELPLEEKAEVPSVSQPNSEQLQNNKMEVDPVVNSTTEDVKQDIVPQESLGQKRPSTELEKQDTEPSAKKQKVEAEKVSSPPPAVVAPEIQRFNLPKALQIFIERKSSYLDANDIRHLSSTCKEFSVACTKTEIWGHSALKPEETLLGNFGPVLTMTGIKSWVFSGSTAGKIKLWNTEKWSCMKTMLMAQPTPPAHHQAGMRSNAEITLAVTALEACDNCIFTGLDNGEVVMNMLTRKETRGSHSRREVGHKAKVNCLKVGGDKLFSGGADGKVSVFDARSLRPLRQLSGHRKSVIAIEIVDNRLFSAGEDGNVLVWSLHILNLETALSEEPIAEPRGNLKANITHHEKLSSMCSAQGKLITCAWDCTMKMWNCSSLQCIASIFLNPLSICWALAVRQTRGLPAHLVCSVREGELELRSLEDLYLLPGTGVRNFSASRRGHSSWINTLVALPDGRIVTGSDDWTLKVWHIIRADHDLRYKEMRRQKKLEVEAKNKSIMASISQEEEDKEKEKKGDNKGKGAEEERKGEGSKTDSTANLDSSTTTQAAEPKRPPGEQSEDQT